MMQIEVNQQMMKQIDTLVSSVGTLGLFVLISLTFLIGLQGQLVALTLLPVIASVMGWKGAYFIYRTRQKGPHVHTITCECVECA